MEIMKFILKELISKKALTYRGGALVWVVTWTVIQSISELHPLLTALIIVMGKHIYYSIVEAFHKRNKVCRHCLMLEP